MSWLVWLILGLAWLDFTVRSPFMLWHHYLAVMSLKRNKVDLRSKKGLPYYAGVAILTRGYLLDLYVNTVHMTFLFWELPQELTVTSRLKRHIRTSEGWRLERACWFIPLLDPYDPSGKHIS